MYIYLTCVNSNMNDNDYDDVAVCMANDNCIIVDDSVNQGPTVHHSTIQVMIVVIVANGEAPLPNEPGYVYVYI